jgi:hypothetical protein
MKKIATISILTCIILFQVHAQKVCGSKREVKPKNKYVLAFVPSYAKNIYGLSLGLLGSEVLCDRPFTQYSYGINFQVFGEGFMQIFIINQYPFKSIYKSHNYQSFLMQNDTSAKRLVHNGLIFSGFGTFTDHINGVSFSPWMSFGRRIKGLSINLLWNLYTEVDGLAIGLFNNSVCTKGIQIGLINKTGILKGFQIGLWNRNSKRGLPLINWNFSTSSL